ncbi:IDEAL domain-containing protein [Bacillus sp. UMB0728]|uniref:IDEAL domain-containing protein n=1 Tax=Bacillus sp. UMB0728 TaxID=2066052 RepID=UPI000C791C36|nr:IDEAL domain-containing protein [Bacillus sp. UMB0728]PLR74226.1 group-specific protein [Bacillus sp. UMB0728]
MTAHKDPILKAGDWVKGKSIDGELLIGYIESLAAQGGALKVTAVTSDNDMAVGKTILMQSKDVKKLPETKVSNKEQIRFLIDLALSTGDEEWFIELSSQINSMRQLVDSIR